MEKFFCTIKVRRKSFFFVVETIFNNFLLCNFCRKLLASCNASWMPTSLSDCPYRPLKNYLSRECEHKIAYYLPVYADLSSRNCMYRYLMDLSKDWKMENILLRIACIYVVCKSRCFECCFSKGDYLSFTGVFLFVSFINK